MTPVKYRPDIDGLRAVAVLLVIASHMGNSPLHGGFTGVDVFIVISGFLITGFTGAALADGKFDFRVFLFRRARRILPALFVVTASTLLLGSAMLLPDDLNSLASSSIAATLCSSNIFFWLTLDTGYFAETTRKVPLLHTWSLGLEEQFYLIWPLIFVFLFRSFRTRTALLVIFILAALSFITAQLALNAGFASFAYYMLPARAGEFLIGAFVALAGQREKLPGLSRFLAEAASMAGAVLIVFSALWMTSRTPFPGVNALYPCAGTVLIIWSGIERRTVISRVLSHPVPVFVGLLSYSLYLWHWPVFAFLEYTSAAYIRGSGSAGLCMIVLLSTLTYKYVEKPCRRISFERAKGMALSLTVTAGGLVLGAAIIIGCGGLEGIISDPSLYKRGLEQLYMETGASENAASNCQGPGDLDAIFRKTTCILGNPARTPGTLLWGDSNAAQLIGFLNTAGTKMGFTVWNATWSQCPPFITAGEKFGRACAKYNNRVMAEMDHYRAAIIAGAWGVYEREDRNMLSELEATLSYMQSQGKELFVVLQVPEFRRYDRYCPLKRLRLPWLDCEEISAYRNEGDSQVNTAVRQIVNKYKNASVVDLRNLICTDKRCSPYADGRRIYFNASHLSYTGGIVLAERFLSKDFPELRATLSRLR